MNSAIGHQAGMVLLLSLVFVLLLALVAGMIARSGTLQLHMTGNDHFREEASQTAQAIAVELSLHPENFSLAAEIGQARCGPAATDPDCASRDLLGPVGPGVDNGYKIDYRVTRRAPLVLENAVPRGTPRDAVGIDVAVFEIEVQVEGLGMKPGRARVIQGVAVPGSGAPPPGDDIDFAVEDGGGSGTAGWESGEEAVESPPGGGGNLYRVYWREPGMDPL